MASVYIVFTLALAGGQWQQAMTIFHKMEAQGLRRDAITYSSTISALAKGKQWSLALQVGVHTKCITCGLPTMYGEVGHCTSSQSRWFL
jgi:pentatricopeptide repeat protein